MMVKVEKLCKIFGPIVAANNISFKADQGEILGFLGPNGAGKSTTMKMLTCFVTPTSGNAEICGHSINKDPILVKKKIGYLPENSPLYDDMETGEFLNFVSQMRKIPTSQISKRIENVVDLCSIQDVFYRPIGPLSKGFKKRVSMASSLIHDPQVLILDEPTDGLDPNQKHEVRTLLKKLSKEKCIVLSTHILEEVDAVCSRAIIIASGKVLFDGLASDFRKKSKSKKTDDVFRAITTNQQIEGVKL